MEGKLAPNWLSPAEVVAAYQGALADPLGGAQLYALHAPEAIVLFERAQARCVGIEAEAFARCHRATLEVWQSLHPDKPMLAPFNDARLDNWVEESAHRAVGWFEATCGRERQPGWLAVGFERIGEAWKIDWATLALERQSWTWHMGKAQTLGNYSSLPATPLARAWTDVAAARLFDYEKPTLLTLPEARFSCQGSTLCCRNEWDITVPVEAQAMLDAIPWETVEPAHLGVKLPVQPDGKLLLKERHQRCRFLDAQRQCTLHKTLGWQPIRTCAIFPYAFAETPDGIAVTGSSLCGAARRNEGAPLVANLSDAHYRRSMLGVTSTQTFKLARDVACSWEVFKAVEAELLELVSRQDIPMYRRLWIGSCRLEALADGNHDWNPAWETEALQVQGEEDVAATEYILRVCMPWQGPRLSPLADRPRARPSHGDYRNDAEMVSIMRKAIFGKTFSYPFDLTTAHNLLTWLYVISLLMQTYYQEEPLPLSLIEFLAMLPGHTTVLTVLADLPGDEPTDVGKITHLAVHGRWLLCYPLPATT